MDFDTINDEHQRLNRFLNTIGPNTQVEAKAEPQPPSAFTPMVQQAIERASKMAEALGVNLSPSQPPSRL